MVIKGAVGHACPLADIPDGHVVVAFLKGEGDYGVDELLLGTDGSFVNHGKSSSCGVGKYWRQLMYSKIIEGLRGKNNTVFLWRGMVYFYAGE